MTRQVILQAIFSSFQQMTQNVTLPQEYSDSFSQAVALIELQEVEDCGSVGGHDGTNPMRNVTTFREYDRFLTLLRKDAAVKIKKECYFTVDKMTAFWKKAADLRETFNTK